MFRTTLLATTTLLASAPAFAQEDDPARPETIIVTGQRLLEMQSEVGSRLGLALRETPATVDVLTQEDLQRQGARTAIEAMNAVPGVQSGNLPGSVGSVAMRGFHRAVNYLHDGVRMPNSDAGMRNWDSWSFERIEVIKGPASVTSGDGALAGAINFVPRRPYLGRFGGELLASYGGHDTARLAGDVNAPLGAGAAMRGNAAYSRSSGWIDDTDSRTFAGSLSLLLRPSERFEATISADYFEDDFSTAYYGTPLVARSIARDPSNVASGSAGLVLDRAMRHINFNVEDARMDSDAIWLRGRAEYRLSPTARIVSDTSWYDSSRLWRDADGYRFDAGSGLIDRSSSIITHEHQFWHQRLHLALDGDLAGRRNRFTAGFEIGETDFFTLRRFGSAGRVDPFAPERGSFPTDPAGFTTQQDVTAEIRSWALFAENAFNVTPELLIVGGLRLDGIEFNREVVDVRGATASSYSQSYDPLTWRLGAVYSLRADTQLYAQYTRAVTPLSGFLFMSAANAAYDLTTGESFEGGIKSLLANDRLELTASAFHIRQDDILTRDPDEPTLVFQGGSQISRGGEASVRWRATDTLTLTLAGTLLEAEFDGLIEAGGADRTGNRPANTPTRIADLTATYTPPGLPLTFIGALRHAGGFFTSNANTVAIRGHVLVDAAVSWNAPFGTLALRGRNLTDAFYADWSGYDAGLVFIGAPRSVELSLTRRF